MTIRIPVDKVDDSAPLRNIWAAIDGYDPVRNAFVNAMVNKFAFTIISSKEWLDPWAFTERGTVAYGETIEEIFVNIARVQSFDPVKAPERQFKRTIPDVRSAFYTMDYQKQYPDTVSRAQLAQAFLSYQGVTDLVSAIISSMYTAMEYDKFITKKYMIAVALCNGAIPMEFGNALDSVDHAKEGVIALRSMVNKWKILNPYNNPAGVYNFDNPEDIFIICDADHEAYINVMVESQAFHLDKVDWLGRIMPVDSFATHDEKRLIELYGANAIEPLDYDLLETVNFIAISRNFLQVYVNFREMGSDYVSSGLYYNYWLNNWMTFAISKFAQCRAFIGGLPKDAALLLSTMPVNVTRDSSTLVGATLTIGTDDNERTVDNASVFWTVSGNTSEDTRILNGNLLVGRDETASNITVTAASVAYPSATASADVAIS